MEDEQTSTTQLDVDPSDQFCDLLWAKIQERFELNDEIRQANLVDLSGKMETAFRAAEVPSEHAPSDRSLENWFKHRKTPQRERFGSLLHVLFGGGWRYDPAALQLSKLRKQIYNSKHPRNRSGVISPSSRSGQGAAMPAIWRQERIDLIGGEARRNSEPFAELAIHLPDEAGHGTAPIKVTMTQGIDEVDIDDQGCFKTFLISLGGSRLRADFRDGCGFVAGSRLGESSGAIVEPSATGVELTGGIWKIPAQAVHQRPLGDEPLFTLTYPLERSCGFSLTLSCRNRQIKVGIEGDDEAEVTPAVREKVIQAYVQKALTQRDDGIVEVTKLSLERV